MLSTGGQLTDIGAWYLGENAAGVSPESTSSSAEALSLNHYILLCALASWLAGMILIA